MATGRHLVGTFVDACAAAHVRAPVVDVEGAAMDLLHRWGDDGRGYHDVEHLTEVLDRLRELGVTSPDLVLAAWFHDAVYDGVPGQDEQRSAQLATDTLSVLSAPTDVVERVAALVLVTADHLPPDGDPGAAALCDADLAVLASDTGRYRRYADGVRREYSHVDDAAFAAGRAAVLRSLLDRPRLYRTVPAQAWEAAARRNVRDELRRLESCG